MDASPTLSAARSPRAARIGRVLLGLSVVIIALNLRALFPSLSALLPEVMAGTGASPGLASLMTTLPVLCLGVFAFAAAPVARRLGTERAVLLALVAVAAGTALQRLWPRVPALLGGGLRGGGRHRLRQRACCPGSSSAISPTGSRSITGLYSMSLSAGAAVAAAFTVPIAQASGLLGRTGLAIWALPAGAAALLWLPRAVRRRSPGQRRQRRRRDSARCGAAASPGR